MQVNAFNETQKFFRGVQYCAVALQSMADAADELQENKDEQGILDVQCVLWWQLAETGSLILK